MPTYAEELFADRDRTQRALRGLIYEQMAVIERLEEELRVAVERLDRTVLKLVYVSEVFGRGSNDTAVVQRDAEDFNTPVVELRQKLERQRRLMEAYVAKLEALEAAP